MNTMLLAVITGSTLIGAFIHLVIVALCFWLLWFLLSYVKIPEPFNKILRVILMVFAVLYLINFLLGMIGHPIVAW